VTATPEVRGATDLPVGPFVAVTVMMTRQGWHAGVFYRAEDDPQAHLLHLAWDRDLRHESEQILGASIRRYVWIAPMLPRELVVNLVEACRSIARRSDNIGQELRYSLRYELGSFDPVTGAYAPRGAERGLTCATFVLAVFRTVGIDLVDVPLWPARPEDSEWIDKVVAQLRDHDPEHADAVASDGLCARFRPTEVSGACLVPPHPVSFTDALRGAVALQRRHDELVTRSR